MSILFCDVVDSTPLGEQLDPESLQRVMCRWFAEARAIVERHGGTVEKFIGDEVMAVFGVPVVHEDDALRAVRSASAMRERLVSLNDELEEAYGVRLAVRIGVNTGEVVVGDPSTGGTFVTGEPVNMAKRLEQAADPGQILIGKTTYPLVANAVQAGPLESFPVKGKREAVSPFRVDNVDAGAPGVARRHDTPLVDRTLELARLEHAFAAAAAGPTCRLVTVVGAAGLGKTRLTEELIHQVEGRARVLTGRCLPYGDGITFWPLIEVLRSLGDDGLDGALAGTEDGEAVAERLASAHERHARAGRRAVLGRPAPARVARRREAARARPRGHRPRRGDVPRPRRVPPEPDRGSAGAAGVRGAAGAARAAAGVDGPERTLRPDRPRAAVGERCGDAARRARSRAG